MQCLIARASSEPLSGQAERLAICSGARLSGLGQDVFSLHKTEMKQPFLKALGVIFPCSISHVTGLVVAAAATSDLSVGVDIEHVSRFVDMRGGAVEAILSPTERALRKDWSPEALLHAWSLKESFVKAMGTGFRDRPNTYELAHLTADHLHDLGNGRFWRHTQYRVGQGHWVTLGILGSHRESMANCVLQHQIVSASEIA